MDIVLILSTYQIY